MSTYRAKRVIVIDTKNQTFIERTINSIDDIHMIVGGVAHPALTLTNGDEVYANEEGMRDPSLGLFYIQGAIEAHAGNAVIIGSSENRNDWRSVRSTLEDIKAKTRFYWRS